jgi:hypothetical protein
MVLGGNDFEGRWLGPVVVAARVSVVTVVSRVHWVQFGSSLAALLEGRYVLSTRRTRVRSNQMGLKQDIPSKSLQ